MFADAWTWALASNRLLIYLSFCIALGTNVWQGLLINNSPTYRKIRLSTVYACITGLACSAFSLLLQTASFADEGLIGLINQDILMVIWGSSFGKASQLLMAGFFSLAFAQTLSFVLPSGVAKTSLWLFSIIAVVCFSLSFTTSGHLAQSPAYNHFAIAIHTFFIALWLGSLWPLWLISRWANTEDCKKIMIFFGRSAVSGVLLIVVCGFWLAYQLLSDISALLLTAYGRTLLLKLGLVSLLLMLAATNKFYWVPKLDQDNFRRGLTRSITFEALIGVSVLGVTAIMTTVVGLHSN